MDLTRIGKESQKIKNYDNITSMSDDFLTA